MWNVTCPFFQQVCDKYKHFVCVRNYRNTSSPAPKHGSLFLTEGMHTVAKVLLFNASYNYTVRPGRDREFGNLLA